MLTEGAARSVISKGLDGVDTSKVGDYIGRGGDGVVFKYEQNKVIKLGDSFYVNYREEKFNTLWELFKKGNYKYIVKPYDFGRYSHRIYWYTMEYVPTKVLKDKDDDILFVSEFLDAKYKHKATVPKLKASLHWSKMARSLVRLYQKYDLKYNDFHKENIRLTLDGIPKLVDLESFIDD